MVEHLNSEHRMDSLHANITPWTDAQGPNETNKKRTMSGPDYEKLLQEALNGWGWHGRGGGGHIIRNMGSTEGIMDSCCQEAFESGFSPFDDGELLG